MFTANCRLRDSCRQKASPGACSSRKEYGESREELVYYILGFTRVRVNCSLGVTAGSEEGEKRDSILFLVPAGDFNGSLDPEYFMVAVKMHYALFPLIINCYRYLSFVLFLSA